MSKIKVLPQNLSNKIAAGEVVERPASVVKELVENAIDADASKISVMIKDGGKKLIRIFDNGLGMSATDCELSLERHATSKILTDTDLEQITTLGFRGEALASIASVSKLTLSSRLQDALEGNEIIIEGGALIDRRVAGIPKGTIISVRDLFFNTPARKKFLKRTVTEMGHISDFIARVSIAFPAIAFELKHDASEIFNLPARATLKDRLGAIFSDQDIESFVELEESALGMKVSGYIAPPSVQRSNATGLYTYVNGRFVRDMVVRHALTFAYRSYMMKGKYPMAILFIEIDPAMVDVNVHPAKSEVRFRDSKNVHSLINRAVEKALTSRQWLTEAPVNDRSEQIREAAAQYVIQNENLPLKGGHADARPSDFQPACSTPAPIQTNTRQANTRQTNIHPANIHPAHTHPANALTDENADSRINPPQARGSAYFSKLHLIGQLSEMYLLCQGANGMILIDQHAALERIAFEELKAGYQDRSFTVQSLLLPETLELTPKEAAAMEEHIDEINRLGFDVEPFGGRSFIVKSTPSILGNINAADLLKNMAGDLSEAPSSRAFTDNLDDTLKRIACHSVVRGRRRMGFDEMRSLLNRIDAAGIVPHCPHGRPIYFELTLSEIEKRFGRI